MADLMLENHGSICIVQPLTGAADAWLREVTDGTWYGGGLVVEPRYVEALLQGAVNEGFEVEA